MMEDENDFEDWIAHAKSTAAICLCVSTMSYTVISVFPYSGFMAIELIEGIDEDSTGIYAGLIASTFSLGRALSSYGWGKIADQCGRKFVLCASMALSCVFVVMFGLSKTFAFAFASRLMLGVSCGGVGAAKTAVTELAYGNKEMETRGMGLMVGSWGWSFLWAPAMGGFLAEPVRQYPYNATIKRFQKLLTRYPFLLPNVVGAVLCLLSILAVIAWVPETLPSDDIRNPLSIMASKLNRTGLGFRRLFKQQKTSSLEERNELLDGKQATVSYSCSSLGTGDVICTGSDRRNFSSRPLHNDKDTEVQTPSFEIQGATIASLWERIDTRTYLILYWIFSFISVCMDEAFPLFCMAKSGGLGISESSIGKVLSASGIMFVVLQYITYASVVDNFGIHKSLVIGSFCAPITLLVPLSLWLNKQTEGSEKELNWVSFLYLSTISASFRIFGSIYYSSIFIVLNDTVPATHRATMNGLQTLGGSVSKFVAPLFSGLMATFSYSSGMLPPWLGSAFIWIILALLGVGHTFALIMLGWKNDKITNDDEGNDEEMIVTSRNRSTSQYQKLIQTKP